MNSWSDERLLQIVWDYMAIESPLQKADAIVIGGCKNTELARYAAQLYREGVAPLVVFSGYAQPGMEITEADLLADTAREADVPESAILREQTASNTGENITLSAKLLKEKGVIPRRVILVHQPFMSRRFLATAEAQWPAPEPEFIVRHEETSLAAYADRHGWEVTTYKTLGDFNRTESYAAKGYQTPQIIPPRVQLAFDTMLDRGYTVR